MKKSNPKSKALGKAKGHPISVIRGKQKFVNSATRKQYAGGIYGGMNLEEAMDFEKRRKAKDK